MRPYLVVVHPASELKELNNHLLAIGGDNVFPGLWLIKSDQQAREIISALHPFVDHVPDMRIFVADASRNAALIGITFDHNDPIGKFLAG